MVYWVNDMGSAALQELLIDVRFAEEQDKTFNVGSRVTNGSLLSIQSTMEEWSSVGEAALLARFSSDGACFEASLEPRIIWSRKIDLQPHLHVVAAVCGHSAPTIEHLQGRLQALDLLVRMPPLDHLYCSFNDCKCGGDDDKHTLPMACFDDLATLDARAVALLLDASARGLSDLVPLTLIKLVQAYLLAPLSTEHVRVSCVLTLETFQQDH
jgi:hypothetical protein